MGRIANRIEALGLVLPAEVPVSQPFPWVNLRGTRVLVSGHGPQEPDGSLAGPFGRVGADLTADQGKALARKAALSMLASLTRALGDLDRITAWHRVFGMVNTGPGFEHSPHVINGFSELVLELFGDEVGRHARSAVGMAALPFNFAVEIEAELEIAA
ncbi:Enamine deaminase RidA, house cleaning of reactive enamine intermediates, YjgF/YER057c/UK114 family [Rhodovulum sp. ES.010]|uniref:RidA family protein n=1 Tax=Rhodovulum sp. ES.010 TaxID=1882821 RepID=UPI000929CBF6|nr:RidA family protein [Rhodovulum sp. ES.010]SIO41414.1 Enamine deaminase RidA, house cleaning of reactive enamine intermediates, YjgF/YER057c/UK114 family [Rhodovulum sp. ES.010]